MLTRRRTVGLLALTPMLFAVGCGEKERSLDPPEIKYGEDMAEMGMPVVDPRFTVATLPKGKDDWLLFDDIGEFLRYLQLHPDDQFDVMWTHDYNDKSWVKAEDAWYLDSPGLRTSPMGWGIATFKDEASAKTAHSSLKGNLYDWTTVRQQTWDSPPKPGE